MLPVSYRNLLVRDAFKVVPLKLAMSVVFFGLSFLGGPPWVYHV